jgi:MerR family transcriptional regulator, heat shock protein HspR
MNGTRPDQLWGLEAAAARVRLPPSRMRRYVRLGLVRPARYEGRSALFGDAELAKLRRLRRLSEDLGLNTAGLEVAIRLLDEIARLQAQLARSARAHDG